MFSLQHMLPFSACSFSTCGETSSGCVNAGQHHAAQQAANGLLDLTQPSWRLFLTLWTRTCKWVAYWRSFCRTVLLMFVLAKRSRGQSCCWVCVLLCPCPAYHTLYSVLQNTANNLMGHRDVPTHRIVSLLSLQDTVITLICINTAKMYSQ